MLAVFLSVVNPTSIGSILNLDFALIKPTYFIVVILIVLVCLMMFDSGIICDPSNLKPLSECAHDTHDGLFCPLILH